MTHTRTEHPYISLNTSKEHSHCSTVHKNRPRDHFNLKLEQQQCSTIPSKEHSNCSNTKILEQSDCSKYPISHRDHFHSSLEHQQRSIIKQMEHSNCSNQKYLEQSHRSNKRINHHYSGNLRGKSKECSIKSPNLEQRQHSIHNCYGAKVSVPNADRSQTYTQIDSVLNSTYNSVVSAISQNSSLLSKIRINRSKLPVPKSLNCNYIVNMSNILNATDPGHIDSDTDLHSPTSANAVTRAQAAAQNTSSQSEPTIP